MELDDGFIETLYNLLKHELDYDDEYLYAVGVLLEAKFKEDKSIQDAFNEIFEGLDLSINVKQARVVKESNDG